MTDSMDRLVDLLQEADGSHDDFVVGVALFANDFDIVDEMIAFIEESRPVSRNQVLGWIKKRLDLKPVITISG